MKTVDHQFEKWAGDQSPKVAKVFNTEFMKYLTDTSPMRTARKVFLKGKRHERQMQDLTQQPGSEAQKLSTYFLAPREDPFKRRNSVKRT